MPWLQLQRTSWMRPRLQVGAIVSHLSFGEELTRGQNRCLPCLVLNAFCELTRCLSGVTWQVAVCMMQGRP